MPDPYLTFVASTVGICLLLAASNVMLAAKSISPGAALAFSVAFSATALTWVITALMPRDGIGDELSLLLTNGFGAIGMAAMWCALWLRSGHRINWLFMGSLVAIWLLPVLGILTAGLHPGTHVPFACASIAAGVFSSVWFMLRKVGRLNAGDKALVGWLIFVLPISIAALAIGMTNSRQDPNAVWMFYVGFLPTLFTGVGLFAMLGFTLDAIADSTELALTDGLTGLLNRRAFDNELAVAVARAERYQRDLTLILTDIDNFKQLNDSYGHPAGDAVIRAVGRVLVEKSRRIDTVARIGGEEFALILADTPSAAGLRLAERLRQAVSNASSESISFTASFGVVSINDTDPTPAALMAAADEALYAAKDAGRNCVRYGADPDREPAQLIELVR